jgi:hypothetical protein
VLRPLLAPGRIEIASLIAYVASTGASFVTDAAFTIDGGYLGCMTAARSKRSMTSLLSATIGRNAATR